VRVPAKINLSPSSQWITVFFYRSDIFLIPDQSCDESDTFRSIGIPSSAESDHNVHRDHETSQTLTTIQTARLDVEDIHHGVVVHRLAPTKRGRSRLLGRSFDYLSFYLSAWRL
jgi:hypothetical protein